MRQLAIAALVLLAACGAPQQKAEPPAAAPTGPSAETEPANTDYQPAFPGQTRVPEMRTPGLTLTTEIIARDLEIPWAIAFMPDGRALVTERAGRLRIVARQGGASQPLAGVPVVDARDQGGLLDVAVSPSFATDRFVYLSFSEPRRGGNGTSVLRGRLSADATRLENPQVIWRQEPSYNNGYHFGSRLVFDRAGHLYVTMGERYERRDGAQTLDNDWGKVVRINADGSIPQDNPFVGQAGARGEIWSIGHRNMQGAALHPETGKLWTIEHGPRGGDELNIPQAGKNYGWPIITYGIEYSGEKIGDAIQQRDGLEQPIYYWDPVIAPSGIAFYQGDLFPWKGDLLIAALSGKLVRLELDGERVIGEERMLSEEVGRMRDVAEAADGSLWLAAESGDIVRVTPGAPAAPAQ